MDLSAYFLRFKLACLILKQKVCKTCFPRNQLFIGVFSHTNEGMRLIRVLIVYFHIFNYIFCTCREILLNICLGHIVILNWNLNILNHDFSFKLEYNTDYVFAVLPDCDLKLVWFSWYLHRFQVKCINIALAKILLMYICEPLSSIGDFVWSHCKPATVSIYNHIVLIYPGS